MNKGMIRVATFAAWLAAASAHAETGRIDAQVVDDRGAAIADAVVIAVPDGAMPPPPAQPRMAVDQIDKEFVPRVQPILVGSLVYFPNKDNIRHEVYSFSPAKRFQLPLYSGTPAKPVLFDKPGLVVLGCNIHDWMIGYIYVSESPYFAKTGADGKASIAELPAGRYTVRLWHPQMEDTEDSTHQSVDLAGAQHADLKWTLKLKPEIHVRRAPTDEHGGTHY
jgi:plastocyanin